MNSGYLIGIDIGTYESKGVLVDAKGNIINIQVKPHNLSIPKAGWAEHDAEKVWWGDFIYIVKNLMKISGVKPYEILGIGCSSIGPDVVPVDEDGKALRQAILYGIDTRASEEIKYLENKIGKEKIFKTCGNNLTTQAVGPKLLWLKNNNPEVFNKAYKFVSATTYLVNKLTDKYYIDHYSASSFVPLYNFSLNKWNEDICRSIVDIKKLPQIAWTTDIAGSVTEEASIATGLKQGTPVIVGTIDAAAEAFSVGVINPGEMMIMYGSTAFLIEILDKPVCDGRLWSAPFLFPGTYSVAGGMATTGAITRWFRDNFSKELVKIENDGGENAYSALAKETIGSPCGSNGLIVLPYFSGERTPINDPNAKGVIFGLNLSHSRGDVYRAILEGVGYGINHNIDTLKDMGIVPQKIISVGGGVKNKEWLQIVSDICGIVQHVPHVTVGASYGDAFLAGLGIGMFSSYKDISKWIRDVKKIKPNLDNTVNYKRYNENYINLYNETKNIMHTL